MNYPSFFTGIFVGIIGLILFMAVIVPDRLACKAAEWVVTRKNVPTMLLPFAALTIILGLWGLGAAFVKAFVGLRIAGWIWLFLIVGTVLVGLWLFVNRKNAAPTHEERE